MRESREFEIVATLGPASWNLVTALRDAGATAYRINASHMTPDELGHRAAVFREEMPESPLIVDLQGAKMRLGHFAEREIHAGERICFSLTGGEGTVALPHREVFHSMARGETLGCDDDRLRFRVESVANGMLDAVALAGGILRPRKGVNVLEHPVSLADVSGFDLDCMRVTAQLGGVAFAFSFMNDGSEAHWIRRRTPGCPIIGKVERREAMENITAIAHATDAIWICRGDLGAQIGPSAMARWISRFDPLALSAPVLLAGQVMEHLTAHPEPTRSEVCHLFDLASRGYAGFVLSDETAIGADPVRAVSTARRLLTAFQS